jgi:hypothetical protein
MPRYPRSLLWLGLILFPLEFAAAILFEHMNWKLSPVTIFTPGGRYSEFPPEWFWTLVGLLSFLLMLVSIFVGIWRWSKVLGVMFVSLIAAALILPLFLVRHHGGAQESSAVAHLREINTAEVTYLSANTKYGSIEDLIGSGLLDPKFDSRKPIAGYRIDFMSGGWLSAAPISRDRGKYAYHTDGDGNIFYTTTPELAPSGEAGHLVTQKLSPDVRELAAALKAIDAAQKKYVGTRYGAIPDLISSGLLDQRFTQTVSGYTFDIVASGEDYTATATPSRTDVGHYGYYSNSDAVIRYATRASTTCTPCFPEGQSGQPVQ